MIQKNYKHIKILFVKDYSSEVECSSTLTTLIFKNMRLMLAQIWEQIKNNPSLGRMNKVSNFQMTIFNWLKLCTKQQQVLNYSAVQIINHVRPESHF